MTLAFGSGGTLTTTASNYTTTGTINYNMMSAFGNNMPSSYELILEDDNGIASSQYRIPLQSISIQQMTNTINIAAKTFSGALQGMQSRLQQGSKALGTLNTLVGGGRPNTFNKYVQGSDLLEEFITFLGEEGVRQGEVMDLPVELFVKWLVIRACEEDQEDPQITLELPAPTPQPRCLGCQKFMARAVVLPMHDQRCAERYFERQQRLVAA